MNRIRAVTRSIMTHTKQNYGWAESEVTAEVSGEANVRKFQSIQRDFRSEFGGKARR